MPFRSLEHSFDRVDTLPHAQEGFMVACRIDVCDPTFRQPRHSLTCKCEVYIRPSLRSIERWLGSFCSVELGPG